MNVVIIGRGAIGSLWLYHLTTQHGINVSALNRTKNKTEHAVFTHTTGLSYSYHYQPATDEHLLNADLLIVCLKSSYCAQVLNNLTNQINLGADIILSHNGMGVIDALNETITNQHNIYTMLTTHGCFKASPYHVIHTGIGYCDIGLSINNGPNIKPHWLPLLNRALPSVNWQKNILEKQWQKLAINCVINPLTAIYKIKNGEITTKRFIKKIRIIADEVSVAALSQGIVLTTESIEQQARVVAEKTARNTSSMLADILAGNTTEIEHINGYICQLAENFGFDASVNKQLMLNVKKASL